MGLVVLRGGSIGRRQAAQGAAGQRDAVGVVHEAIQDRTSKRGVADVVALRLASEYAGTIHLLLTDIVRPMMNGRNLATALRAARPCSRTSSRVVHRADVMAARGVLEDGVQFRQKPGRAWSWRGRCARCFAQRSKSIRFSRSEVRNGSTR